MTTNVTAETRLEWGEGGAELVMTRLERYAPACYPTPEGRLMVTITLPVEGVLAAADLGSAVLGRAGLEVCRLSVVPTEEFDRYVDLGELVSVSDAAAVLGVSRQAVLQRISSGSLPAVKVGDQWILSGRVVEAARKR